MNCNRPAQVKSPLFVLTVLLFLTALTAGCASRRLPSNAASALREQIAEWAGAETTFEIVSAHKAGDDADDFQVPTGINPDTTQLGACPPAGTSETWCVVISPAIRDRDGNTLSHFLVQSQGRYWDAQKLLDTDASVFAYHGCANWDGP